MIFGFVGPHCTGKTTFVHNYRKTHPNLSHVGYVHGDLTTDNYPLVPPRYRESHYFRQLESKVSMVTDFIRDKDKLWIVEGCRFWTGMIHYYSDIIQELNGGLFMVVVVTSPELMLNLMKKRAIDNNRTLKESYWTYDKLEYEARRRQINACTRALQDSDWITVEFSGSYSMWNHMPKWLLDQFVDDKSLWYGE